MKKSIIYFDGPGPANTEETIKASYERSVELGKDDVVATAYGDTALKAAEIFDANKFNLVAITISEGFMNFEGWRIKDDFDRAGLVSILGVLEFQGLVDHCRVCMYSFRGLAMSSWSNFISLRSVATGM